MIVPVTKPTPRIRKSVPPLVHGDRLDAPEFHRRYAAMPEHVRAELIEGVVHMASPLSAGHAKPHFNFIVLIGDYVFETPGLVGYDNVSYRLNLRNEYQPDLLIARGEDTEEGDDDIVTGSSELAVEICRTSRTIDFTKKFKVYREHKVAEYMIWDAKPATLHWWRWVDGKYEPLVPDAKGIIRSVELPGLWLDTVALKDRDRKAARQTMQLGVASPEHAAFVERLKTEASK